MQFPHVIAGKPQVLLITLVMTAFSYVISVFSSVTRQPIVFLVSFHTWLSASYEYICYNSCRLGQFHLKEAVLAKPFDVDFYLCEAILASHHPLHKYCSSYFNFMDMKILAVKFCK